MKPMNDKHVLATDADNTLWDTDRVFAEAQLALLKRIEDAMGIECPAIDRLDLVRKIDQEIAQEDHRGLKYPIEFLIHRLGKLLVGSNTDSIPPTNEREIADAYIEDIRRRPALRPGVFSTLSWLHDHGVEVWVVSEGVRDRVQASLNHHKIDRFITSVVSAEKTEHLYKRLLKRAGSKGIHVVVGDQLDRDIVPAKTAGWRTAYFPGGFEPAWIDNRMTSYADAVIADFGDLIAIFDVRSAA